MAHSGRFFMCKADNSKDPYIFILVSKSGLWASGRFIETAEAKI